MAKRSRPLRVMIAFVKVTGILGAFGWFSSIGLGVHYAYTRPTSENPSIGRIYSFDMHGYVVYLTRLEMMRLHFLMWTGVVLLLAAAFMGLIAKKRERAESR